MKKFITALFAVAVLAVTVGSWALPVNLPHHNRSDVDDEVRVFIPYSKFSMINISDRVLASATYSTTGPVVKLVTPAQVAGLQFTGTGQNVPLLIELPDSLCVDCNVRVSVVWSTDENITANTATWRVTYGRAADGSAIPTPNTALNTPITADTVNGTNFGWNETPIGVINASTFSRDDIMSLSVDLNSTSGLDPDPAAVGGNNLIFHGINLYYVRERL